MESAVCAGEMVCELSRGPGGGLCVVFLKKVFYSHVTVMPILTNHSLGSWVASRKNGRAENGERSFMRAVLLRCVSSLFFSRVIRRAVPN